MSDGPEAVQPATLLIGAVAGPEGAPRAAFLRLDATLLARVNPQRVICALFAGDSDAMMVAERLAELGWRGVLTVLAPGLPNRRMVQQELQAIAPWITVEVVADA